jgi:hypothetical protein
VAVEISKQKIPLVIVELSFGEGIGSLEAEILAFATEEDRLVEYNFGEGAGFLEADILFINLEDRLLEYIEADIAFATVEDGLVELDFEEGIGSLEADIPLATE